MKYIWLLLLLLSISGIAGAADMELAWTGGYFYRPVDDGIEHDGPGSGVTFSRRISNNWWVEGEVRYGWSREISAGSWSSFSKEWKGFCLLGGIYKRWPSGRFSWFAGASLGTILTRESRESTFTLPDENDLPHTFHDNNSYTSRGGVILGKAGAIVNIGYGLAVRMEAELTPAYIPNVGTSLGLAWRF